MRPIFRSAVVLTLFAFMSCGDSSGPGDRTTLDFEDRPDDGFNALTLPVTLGTGVVFTEVQPAGTFYDMSTADGWGLIGCDASAFSGTLLIGFEGSDTVTGVITFDPPVRRVDMYVGVSDGENVVVTAFNAADAAVDSASHLSACPMLGTNDLVSVAVGSNTITRIEIRGTYPAIDDLSYFR